MNPEKLQRGDVVRVTFENGDSYKGVLWSVARGRYYIVTRDSGHSYKQGSVKISLVKRNGLCNFKKLSQLSQEFE